MEDRELQDLKLLTAEDLGQLLGRSPKSIKMYVTSRPHTLPPRFIVPGVRSPRWRQEDVRKWMQEVAEQSAEETARSQRKTQLVPGLLRLARKD